MMLYPILRRPSGLRYMTFVLDLTRLRQGNVPFAEFA